MRISKLLLFGTICFVNFITASAEDVLKKDCTDLARDEETLLVFSTLGGGLTAIDPITSEIRWTIADEPTVKSESNSNIPLPHYMPDPRDGSIYQLSDVGNLKKLPYTIPELVASAPCRSSDGILYSGKKSDVWFLIDPKTGRREKLMGFGGQPIENNVGDSIGWATSRSIYLGRTQYTVMMFDSLSKNKNSKPWNITFYDYASHTMAPEISNDYEYIHLAGSSSGKILTLSRKGVLVWEKDLKTPVVAVFLLSRDGLLSVPFTTVADEALLAIIEEAKDGSSDEIKLFQSLYIGEHSHGLYALPSLVDKNTMTITSNPPNKLIEGPENVENSDKQKFVYLKNKMKQKRDFIVLGHYELPSNSEEMLIIGPTVTKSLENKQLSTQNNVDIKSDFIIVDGIKSADFKENIRIPIDKHVADVPSNNIKSSMAADNKLKKILNDSRAWLTDEQSGGVHQILLLLILIVITMFWYMCSTLKEIRYNSQNGSKTKYSNQSSSGSDVNYEDLEDLGNGEIKVGKITFNSNLVLGKGCEGTFVFKGSFEKRQVAVKRLLPECFTFADREVALLRESDEHENVVRYFCTEQDRQFRYIAVELCAVTLQEFVEGGNYNGSKISALNVLKQATAGLCHLHSLNIVHRDIKPQNVLLSFPDKHNRVRAMISDFGLCKKLNYGKTSFSHRSGITGTEGWIAPEMLKGQRTTTSVDIFSLGCVFYYVLTKGEHAFGDTLKRQANILSNEYDLNKLSDHSSEILAKELITDMIHYDVQKRPNAASVHNHPIFWNDERILAFLQDVSDRVEKLTFSTEPLKTLEKNGRMVVKEDWSLHLDPIISNDLRRFRGYMGASVRDLLRALRNKRHHYHELNDEVQRILGAIPIQFTSYWITKFPFLLSHAYHALNICSEESIFEKYYDKTYKFSRPQYFFANESQFMQVMDDPKLLQKNETNSPKRYLDRMSPKKNAYRKGVYNFHKYNNIENDSDKVNLENDKRKIDDKNVFANFKFRNKRNNKNAHSTLHEHKSNSKDDNNKWILLKDDH